VYELGFSQRIVLAISTPFRYAGRLLMPVSLSPVYPLPIGSTVPPVELVLLVLVAVATLAILARLRQIRPLVCAVAVFLLLLAPTLLAPTGVQASADRYLYIALGFVCVLAGTAVTASRRGLMPTALIGVLILSVCVGLTIRQVSFWRDSVTLWSRAVAVDDRNDIATYNLASAFVDAKQVDAAIVWYERTIALVPDHAQARKSLASLQAVRHEADAAKLATAGQFATAIDEYTLALTLDPARSHARAGRGVALARIGRWDDAVSDLTFARRSGIGDAELSNALAFALAHLGRDGEAVGVLKNALRLDPDNISLAHNLAQLLLDSSDEATRDVKLAQVLALEVCKRTGNQDPRALETLAMAYVSNGNRALARQTAERGLGVARASGDAPTAEALQQMLRRLGS
jgi:tetratricopeptide (TPR) repeat protein